MERRVNGAVTLPAIRATTPGAPFKRYFSNLNYLTCGPASESPMKYGSSFSGTLQAETLKNPDKMGRLTGNGGLPIALF